MLFLKIVAILFGVLVVSCFSLSAYLFRFACRRDGRGNEYENLERLKKNGLSQYADTIKEGFESFHAAEKEDVYITSRDGLRLHGYLIPHEDAKGTIVMIHGWRSRVAYDFSAIWKKYYAMGYNLLGIEQRAIGGSEGKYICFGAKERYDLIDWVKFLNGRFGEEAPVIFSGISMGCSTVMFAIGNEELPKNVVGAIADCGFTSAWDEFCYLLKNSYHLPKFPFLYIAEGFARLFCGFSFRACNSTETLKNTKIPVLFIHGEADNFVPLEHTLKSHAACASRCELLTVKDAEHGMSYLVDQDNADKKLTDFLNSLTKKNECES
ncbi:MAG: alpha/beta hydrolase [Ruminococcaceae bacterium]|nr:alpha/beta hydrolase [Oscillospiraceae bacterium]